MIIEQFQNHELRLGKNQKENDDLITDASINDYWVHIKDYTSGHCIITNLENIKMHKKVLKRACCLVKQHSKYSSIKKLSFTITQIKHLEKTDVLGKVIVNNVIRTITI